MVRRRLCGPFIIILSNVLAHNPKPDPRLNAWRDDLAAAHLRGEVDSPQYGEARHMQVIAPVTALRRTPADGALQDSQLLFGEDFDVYDVKNGWAWGQARADDYVGYMLAEDLASPVQPTHKLAAQRSFIYREADIKTRPLCGISFGARLTVSGMQGRFAALQDGGFIYAAHLDALEDYETDPIAVARRFIGAPYFWGGREASGLDCSALIQLALTACGYACPRDSDMQATALGRLVDTAKTGDIVFWKGHVGFISGDNKLLHANAFHMSVVEEDFDAACARISETDGAVTAIKRL